MRLRKPEPDITEAQRDWFMQLVPVMTPFGYPALSESLVPLTQRRFDTMRCEHCGGVHVGACPRVASIEYHENGRVKTVCYRERWDASGVIYLDASAE